MADIAKIKIGSTTYNLKDTDSRQALTYIQEIKTDLAARGIFTDITIIECGPGKSYTSLIDAVSAATALNNAPCIIKLYEGSYDVSGAANNGLIIPDNCYIIGIGTNTSVAITGVKTSQYWSPLNLTKNNGLYNIYVYGANCRYVVHDDADTHLNYSHRIIKNCIFQGANLTMNYVYGAGMKAGTNLLIENTIFMNDTAAAGFSIHNMTKMIDSADIKLKNCDFYVTSAAGNFPETIRLAGVMNYEDSSQWETVYVTIEDCSNVFLSLDTEYPDPTLGRTVPYQIFGNGEWAIRLLNNTLWEPQKIHNKDMFITAHSYDGTEQPGDPIFRTGGFLVPTTFQSIRPPFTDGICVKAGGATNVQTVACIGGIIPLTAIGISDSVTNKLICWPAGSSSRTPVVRDFGTADTWIVTGAVTDYGFAKITKPFLGTQYS